MAKRDSSRPKGHIHKIVVACGTAIATSTHVSIKLKELLEERGLRIRTVQCRVSEVPDTVSGASAVVATSQVPFDVDVPIFNGIPFLTGLGIEEVIDKIEALLREQEERTPEES
jgi:PTS system galactitol-specific IIB component